MKELLESGEFKPLYMPVLILLGLILLSIMTVKIFFDKNGEISAQIQALTATNAILEAKLTSLQSNASIASASELTSQVLPNQSGSLSLISELKKNAASFSITIDNLRVGTEVTGSDGVPHVDINFDATGTYSSLQSLLDKMRTSAPISIIRQIKLTKQSESSITTVTLSTFSSPFPEKLPAITEPLNDLTPDEKDVLSQINTYTIPTGVNVKPLSPQSPIERPDPFSL